MGKNYTINSESVKASKVLLDSLSAPSSKSGVPPKAKSAKRPDYTPPSQKARKDENNK